jgi:hypothetical protein
MGEMPRWVLLVTMIVGHLARTGTWPTHGELDHPVLRELGEDLDELLDEVPVELIPLQSIDFSGRPSSAVFVTHLALHLFGGDAILERLVGALRYAALREAAGHDGLGVEIHSDDFLAELGVSGEGRDVVSLQLHTLLGQTHCWTGMTGGDPNTWTVTVDRRVRPYGQIAGIEDYLKARPPDPVRNKPRAVQWQPSGDGPTIGSETPVPEETQKLTRKEISRLVHNWIGLSGGYLGDFSYASHDRFWMENCDLHVSTSNFAGTTRACFEETLFEASASDQALALRAILEDYPSPEVPDPSTPKFRSAALHREIVAWISRLETGEVAVVLEIATASEVVRRALDDADTLLRTSGPQSAVDRVHTAMHGYLHSLCDEAGIVLSGDRPTMNQLFKALRSGHPGLSDLGARPDEITRVLQSMATILDSLNPVRNNASVAHPNNELIGKPEAMLVINTVRTLLSYLESKRRE